MVKVLQVVWGLNIGGAETFLYNVLSKLNPKEFHIDFVIQDPDIKNEKLLKLCQQNKWSIYKVPPFNRNVFAYIKCMRDILNHPYDVMHIHVNALINTIPIYLAKKRGIKIIVHSHNSSNNLGGRLGKTLHLFNRNRLRGTKTINIACSDLAGKWMFGNEDYLLLENGVDIDTYKYSIQAREKIRREFGIEGRTVIGHVGRFVEAKNHEFILRVFKQYLSQDKDAILMLVGDGSLKKHIEEMADKMEISDQTIFTGERQDTSEFYSAFDSLLFPSLFEGLPFVLVEAQSSGLPIITSDRVTREINLTGIVRFLNLEDNINEWVEAVSTKIDSNERIAFSERMKKTKYNIEFTVNEVKRLYSV